MFSDVDNDMTIAREEIFGPVLSIIPYEDEDDAVRIANDTPGVEATTDIRSRGRPDEAFAELTIQVHPGTNVREAHELADAVEERLRKGEGLYGVVVHVEPRSD